MTSSLDWQAVWTWLQQAANVLLLLSGGALGVLLAWWLDGRRAAAQERRSLAGACLVVGFELANNVAMADQWASLPERLQAGVRPEHLEAAPILLRQDAWERNQNELARGLPRDLTINIGRSYELTRIFGRNVAVAQRRGGANENDIALANRTRDACRQALHDLQDFEERHLAAKFQLSAEERDAGLASLEHS